MTSFLSPDPLTVAFYAVIIYASLHFFYIAFANSRWEELDLEQLRRKELHLAHLIQLLDAPDVQALSRERSDRGRLFPGMARFLLDDVLLLLHGRRRPQTLLRGCLFLFGYGLLKVKSPLGWGRNDLHFLAGLELAVVRSLSKDR